MKNTECVLEIVKLAFRADEQLLVILKSDDKDEIVHILEQQGIQVKKEDVEEAVREATDVLWLLQQLEGTAGSTKAFVSSGSQPAVHQVQPRQTGEVDLGLQLRQGLVNVLKQIDQGYVQVMRMYSIAFYLGVTMLLVSVIASLVWREDASPLVLGGFGMAGVIASLIFRPAQDLQNSRGNLAQLQAAFSNWVADIYNWDQYLYQLRKEAAANNRPPSYSKMRQVSDTLMENTRSMMEWITLYTKIGADPKIAAAQVQSKQPIRGPSESQTAGVSKPTEKPPTQDTA